MDQYVTCLDPVHPMWLIFGLTTADGTLHHIDVLTRNQDSQISAKVQISIAEELPE